MNLEDIAKMSLVEINNLENNIWNIPNVDGKAQVPYLYGINIHELLNACIARRKELKNWAFSDNGSTSPLQGEGQGSIP